MSSTTRHPSGWTWRARLTVAAGVFVGLAALTVTLALVDAVRRGRGLVPLFVASVAVAATAAALGAYFYERLSARESAGHEEGRTKSLRPPPRRGRASRWLAALVRPWLTRPRRRRAATPPFPEAWRALLSRRCRPYGRLPASLRRECELQIRRFVSDKPITGVEAKVTDEVRLLVAASAAIVSAGWEGFHWRQVSEVLVYPQAFDADDYSFAVPDSAGQAHPWGIVILSLPSLAASFDQPEEGFHVGIHEFVHLLDLERGEFDGLPLGFGPDRSARWERLRAREQRRLLRGRSALHPYGLTNEVEFLAVAAESFFQTPVELRQSSPALYALLAGYFRQDPAAWARARRPVRAP